MSKELDKKIADLLKESEELDKKVQEFDKAEEAKAEEERTKVEVAPPKPYNVFGRNFSVTEPHIVEYYKNRLEMMTIKYKLLGKFDEDGCYSISTDVKYELVEMQKEIEEMGSDFYRVSANVMKKYFNFFIKMTMLEEGKAKASLYLLEYAGQNVDSENIETHIGDFIDIYDADFRIKLRKAFNLVDVDAKNNDFEIPNIAVILQDLIDTEFYMGGLYDMASQIYIMRMLKLLENGGEEEREILERFKQLLAEMQKEDASDEEGDDKYKLKKEKHLNEKRKELLDKAIDEKGGLEKLNVDKKELKGCVDELNKTDQAISELSTSCAGVLDIEEIKNLKKPQSSSSGSGSSSSGNKKPAKKANGGGGGGSKKKASKKPKKEDGKGKAKSGGGVVWVTPAPAETKPSNPTPPKPQTVTREPQRPVPEPQPPVRPRPTRPTRRRPQQNLNEEDLDVLLDEAFNEVDSDRSLKEQVNQDVLTPAEKVDKLDQSLNDQKADDKEMEKITRETHGRERASFKLDPPEREIDLDELEIE